MSRTVDPRPARCLRSSTYWRRSALPMPGRLLGDDERRFPALGEAVGAGLAARRCGAVRKVASGVGARADPGRSRRSLFLADRRVERQPDGRRGGLLGRAAARTLLLYVKQPIVWAEGGDSAELPAAKGGRLRRAAPRGLPGADRAARPGSRAARRRGEGKGRPAGRVAGLPHPGLAPRTRGGPDASRGRRPLEGNRRRARAAHPRRADALPAQALVRRCLSPACLPRGAPGCSTPEWGNADELWGRRPTRRQAAAHPRRRLLVLRVHPGKPRPARRPGLGGRVCPKVPAPSARPGPPRGDPVLRSRAPGLKAHANGLRAGSRARIGCAPTDGNRAPAVRRAWPAIA